MKNVEFGIVLKYDGKEVDTGVSVSRGQLSKLGIDAENFGKKAAGNLDQVGMSAKATAAALRGVPAQFTDIVTSLQGGQAPLTVFLQQGGQLKDMFGGAGNAAKALGGYVLGMVNPFTVAAGVVGALGVAYYQGSAEVEAFQKSLILSGNAAGTTAGQLMDMANTVASSTGATRGAVAETLDALAASGKVSADMLGKVSQAAVDLERVGGAAASDTVAQFVALGDSPVAAVLKLNDKYQFLTASVYEQVKALQDQGRESEAARVAQTAYVDAIEGRVPALVNNLGTLETAWRGVKDGAKWAWDAMLNVGREAGLKEQLAKAEQTALYMSRMGSKEELASYKPYQDALLNVDAIKEQIGLTERLAVTTAATNDAREAGLRWEIEGAKYLDKKEKKEAEILRVTNMMTAAGKDQAEIAKVLSAIEEKYAEKKSAGVKKVASEYNALFLQQEQEKLNLKALNAELAEMDKARQDYAKSVAALLDPIEKEAYSLEQQAATYGLTRAEIEATTIARLEEARAIATANGASAEALAFYEREIDARKRIQAASENIDAKKASEDWIKESNKASQKTADQWDKTSDKIGDSITDALMRGFESGKDFAETLKDTVVNMYKTMVLQPTIKAVVVGGLSAVGMGSATAADGTSSAGMGNMLSTGNSIFQTGSMLAGGYGALPLTETIANGVGMMGGDSLGSLIGMSAHWTAGGAAVADLGASIGTAAGTALAGSAAGTVFATTATGAAVSTTTAAGVAAASGTAAAGGAAAATGVMAAIPVVGWIAAAAAVAYMAFGHKKTQDTGAVATSTNGGMGANVLVGRGTSADTFDAGMAAGVSGINKSYFDTLNPLLAALGNKQVFSITSDQSAKKKGSGNQYAGFDIGVDGQKSTLQYGFGKVSDAEALAKATSSALGEGISRAISMSDLSEPIKRLFAGVIDQAVVGTMVAGLTKVGNASKELNDVWGISVSQAAEVAMLTGQTQEGIAKTVDAIGAFALAQRTVGATLESAYASLDPVFTALTNSALPANLAAYDKAMKDVDTTAAAGIETFAALFAMREGFAQMRAVIDGLKTGASTAIDAFRTPEERLTLKQSSLSDLSSKAGISVPTSGAELVKLFDGIDFTRPTQAGMNLAAALPAIAAAFADVQNAEKAFTDALGTTAQSVADAAKRIAEERSGLQDQLDELTMNNAQLLGKQRDALDESNRGLFDQIAAINAANAAMADLASQIEAIGNLRTNVQDSRQGVISQMSGFDAVGYYGKQVKDYSGKFAKATTTNDKLDYGSKWQSAIASGLDAQIAALGKTKDARIAALQAEADAISENAAKQKQAAQAMASALENIAQYAKNMLTGNLSTLSPEAKLAAASNEYNRLYSASRSGDATAAGQLTGASDTYLGLAKDYYASTSGYTSIFGDVQSQLSGLGSQASVYEQIANSTSSTYDLAKATAAVDAAYQAQVLALQQAAVDQYTVLDKALEKSQIDLELKLDDTVIELQTLGVKSDTIAERITTSQAAVTASVARVEAAQEKAAALLAQVAALMEKANTFAEKTANATSSTASSSSLAGSKP